MMAEEAKENTTTTSTNVTLNIGYPTSWQGVLKIAKIVFLFCCLVCSALLVSSLKPYNSTYWDYCLAIAVLGLVSELVVAILYFTGTNKRWADNAVCGILIMIYHVIMLILVFVAIILMTGTGAGPRFRAAQAYNAFAVFTIIGFSLEIYLNLIWIRGGPELAALSLPGQ